MEPTVNLDNVQHAIQQLRGDRERVSRRNVRAITGGSMSTVHRLMNQIEEAESLQGTYAEGLVSKTFINAIHGEFQAQLQKTTAGMQEQIITIKEREKEAVDSLSQTEDKIVMLEAALLADQEQLSNERNSRLQLEMSAKTRQEILEQKVTEARIEIDSFRALLEKALLEKERVIFQSELLRQDLIKSEVREKRLSKQLSLIQKQLTDAEKQEAVAMQQIQNLCDRLSTVNL